jgi:hypothetical protein
MRVAVHTCQAEYFDIKSSLFLYFPYDTLRDAFAGFEMATRQTPFPIVGSPREKKPPTGVENGGRARDGQRRLSTDSVAEHDGCHTSS